MVYTCDKIDEVSADCLDGLLERMSYTQTANA
jgi:hypothetical protein